MGCELEETQSEMVIVNPVFICYFVYTQINR